MSRTWSRAPWLLALALLSSCQAPPSLVARVTAPENLDKLWLVVRGEARDDKTGDYPLLVNQLVTDPTKGGSVRYDGEGVTVAVDLPSAGQYGVILIGWSGNIDCLAQAAANVGDGGFGSIPDGGAPGVGDGRQYFFARGVDVKEIEKLDVAMYLVDRKAGSAEDLDCDGFPSLTAKSAAAAKTSPLYLDCNDGEPIANPIARELCSAGIDQNCDGVKAVSCGDQDDDGDPDRTDCDPKNPKVHHPITDPASPHFDPYPEAPNCCGYSLGKAGTADASRSLADSPLCHAQSCGDGVDYDCDGKPSACKRDQDCDTFLAGDKQADGCMAAANSPAGNDCNDCDPKTGPLAAELCDGKDNNCNGLVDETCVSCDLDGDGWQRSDAQGGCPDKNYPMGRTTDCNDDDSGVYPDSMMTPVPLAGLAARSLPVTCTGKDAPATVACALRRYCLVYDGKGRRAADCNGPLPGCPDAACDADGDGFMPMRAAMGGMPACSPPPGLVDCDDKDGSTFPGAPESCLGGGDGGVAVDHDCDGKVTACAAITDSDGDGYADEWDCASNNPSVHPFATEVCDGLDNDCNGLVDEGNPDGSGRLLGTVALGNAADCVTAGTGACGTKPFGHCVCSGTSTKNLHFDGKRPANLVCPTEIANVEGRPGARCFFSKQPATEVCDGQDNSCSGGDDLLPADHKAAGIPADCPGPVGMAQICCPPPQGQMGAPSCKDPLADVDNCGNCGQRCIGQNGTPACVMGACAIACAPGFGTCDKDIANGCETSTLTDPDNCGAGGPMSSGCGVACSNKNVALRSCSAGVCSSTCLAGFADCNLDKLSDGCETSTYDPKNCGKGGSQNGGRGPAAGCGCVCSSVHGTPLCNAGTCSVVCAPGYGNCDGIVGDSCSGNFGNDCETPIDTDVNNCGGCSQKCSTSNIAIPLCVGGSCRGNCNAGFADCDNDKRQNGCETATNTADNCGPGGGVGTGAAAGCGCSCSKTRGTPTCNAGQCAIACAAGFANCDGVVSNSCGGGPDNGCEISTLTDVNNCGAGGVNNTGCGCKCATSGGTPTCTSGTCGIVCDVGFANCDGVAGSSCGGNGGNGCEVFVQNDPNNCGVGGANNAGCGVKCAGAAAHIAVPTCTLGQCSGTCDAGFADCNNNKQADGCETAVLGDINNCGSGGAVNGGRGAAAGCGCSCSVQNGTPSCGAGKCAITCAAGFANCDGIVGNSCAGNAGNGCEVSTLTDVNNCGAGGPGNAGCGVVCSIPNATPACVGGLCKVGVCSANFGNCDAQDANGCESSLLTDPNNCSKCGTVCADPPNAQKGCAAGKCGIGACLPGFADCNLLLVDGCEVSTQSSVSNCGGCGMVCPAIANGTAACLAGKCGVGGCNVGFLNCDANAVNGCEANSQTDKNNCGSCGNVCPVGTNASSVACVAGKCVAACAAGFLDCDGNAANGCEVNGQTNLSHCGKCGNVCAVPNHANGAVCTAGVCGIASCQAPWSDCDMSPANGCEIDLNNNHANCGACLMACGASFDCLVGGCVAQPLFAPMVANTVGPGGPTYFAQADLNGDTFPDIISTYGFLAISLGNGDGTFKAYVQYTTFGNQTQDIGIGDFNSDGKLDIAAGTSGATSFTINTGKGDGTLNAAVAISVAPIVPRFLRAADFTKDGSSDVVLFDAVTNALIVLPSNGNGTFGAAKTPALLNKPALARMEVLDVNVDGNLDVVVSENSRNLEVFLGNGDGTFKVPAVYATNGIGVAYDFKYLDVDGDGKKDFITSSQGNFVQLLRGNGDGTFQSGVSIFLGTGTVGVAAIDANADGRMDLVATDNSVVPNRISVLVGNGDGTYSVAARTFTAGNSMGSLLSGDYNRDGKPDIIAANPGSSNFGVFLGQ